MTCSAHRAPRPRPVVEVADIVRECGDAYRATHRLSVQQSRVLQAIAEFFKDLAAAIGKPLS